MNNVSNLDTCIQCYVNKEIKKRFKDICSEKGITISSVMRQYVVDYVKQNS